MDRKLVREGLLQKVTGYKSKERFVMLFEDLLLIGKPSLMNKARYQLESQLQPDKIIVKGDIKVGTHYTYYSMICDEYAYKVTKAIRVHR